MVEKIYVVLSEKRDITSVANRAFRDFNDAWEHKVKSEKELATNFYILSMELEDKNG